MSGNINDKTEIILPDDLFEKRKTSYNIRLPLVGCKCMTDPDARNNCACKKSN